MARTKKIFEPHTDGWFRVEFDSFEESWRLLSGNFVVAHFATERQANSVKNALLANDAGRTMVMTI